ncbi:uncharacterized protein LOC119187746 isoform X1 [Rhipicephalus microplus]|uniref:uncharacterized protein LOC119187746 isoform X1 n=3 Tax=Rhipicephalus microplus TaxID=6941 RepID=UPI003F6D84D3
MVLFILRLGALVVSAFLSTVYCSSGDLFPTMNELQEALKTGEKIWLKRANYFYLHLDCFAWQKIWLNGAYYSMYVWYRKTEHWFSQKKKTEMRATLFNKTRWPEMNIWYPEQKGHGTPYVMRFWQKREKCAVFELPGGKCEQRVWNSHVGNTHLCDEGYRDICGGWNKMIYHHNC